MNTPGSDSSSIRTANDSELLDFDRVPEGPAPPRKHTKDQESDSNPTATDSPDDGTSKQSQTGEKGKGKALEEDNQSDVGDDGLDYQQGMGEDVDLEPDEARPLEDILEEDENGETTVGEVAQAPTEPKRRKPNPRCR